MSMSVKPGSSTFSYNIGRSSMLAIVTGLWCMIRPKASNSGYQCRLSTINDECCQSNDQMTSIPVYVCLEGLRRRIMRHDRLVSVEIIYVGHGWFAPGKEGASGTLCKALQLSTLPTLDTSDSSTFIPKRSVTPFTAIHTL